jgi:hypothetical protein
MAAFTCIVLLAAFLPFAVRTFAPVLRLQGLIDRTPREDYLASLRDRPLVGCLLMREISPDLLVLGDSHAYAGIDYVDLEKSMAPTRVGHCAIGAAFLETMDQWLTYFETSGYRPKNIILATSPRMFAVSSNKEARRAIVQKFLFDDNFKSNAAAGWLRDEADGAPAFGDSAAAAATRLARHRPRLEALDDRQIELTIQRSNGQYLRNWNSAGKIVFTKGADVMIAKACTRLNRLGIKLTVAHLPMSPRAWRQYTLGQKAEYDSLLQQFSQCAIRVFVSEVTSGLVTAKDFVNRQMSDDYDYGIWGGKPQEFGKDGHKLIDFDHMNAAAAQRFTLWLARELKK